MADKKEVPSPKSYFPPVWALLKKELWLLRSANVVRKTFAFKDEAIPINVLAFFNLTLGDSYSFFKMEIIILINKYVCNQMFNSAPFYVRPQLAW